MSCTKEDMKKKYKKGERKRIKKEERYRKRVWAVIMYKEIGKDMVGEVLNVTVRTVNRWIKRFREGGYNGLRDRSRRPKRIHRISDEIKNKIIEIRDIYNSGCEKIGIDLGISSRTVYKVLKERGKIKKRKKVWRKWKHYERKFSNVLWHLDFTELYSDLWLLLVIDDHSRFILGYKTMKTPNVYDTLELLEELIKRYGAPEQILTDHGSQFYAVRGGVSTFDIFCLEREIRHILASVRHPQTNGKVERKMSIVKEYLMKFGYPGIRIPNTQIQDKIEEFITYHNYHRIHFAYHYYTIGGLEIRKKSYFLPFLRYFSHFSSP